MRRYCEKLTIFLLAILLLLPGRPGTGQGKVLETKKPVKEEVERTGGRIVDGAFGTIKGYPSWKSGYDSKSGILAGKNNPKIVVPIVPGGFPAEKGTMVIWFYYEGGGPEKEYRSERLFSVVDNNAVEIFRFTLIPAPVEGHAKTAVFVSGRFPNIRHAYGEILAFEKKVPARRWSYIVLTWGPDPAKDNRVYLNGDPATGAFDGYAMKRPVALTVKAGPVFAGGKAFYVGGDLEGSTGFYRGSIGDIEIHDEILTSFKFPPRGLPNVKSVADDTFKIPGISGKLVAGDRINVAVEGDPGETAWFDFGPVKGIPMQEDAAKPGAYAATFTVPPGIFAENERIAGYIDDHTGLRSEPVLSPNAFSVDSRSRFALTIDKTDLPADSTSTARVKVKVSDANEKPVSGHPVKVTLATTDEYTGLVGGGAARSREAAATAKDLLAGAEVETRWKGVTDSWGEVEFNFKAGFAAKTIILQAKDMASGDVGVDYITSYKEASIDIALTAPRSLAAARRGVPQYILKIEATRTELTADGRSRSVIRATLLDPNGRPVPGDPIVFSLSSPNGSLRTIAGTTDASGVATAEYTAGKKIGIVVVTATAAVRGVSNNVSILLLADAPAKVILKARPESLPADGNSRADIQVKVTDINDNPNKDTKVEFRLANRLSGRLEFPDRMTDKSGDAQNRFTAGTTPGVATILATVRSRIPTDNELAKARNILFVPASDQGEDLKVQRWLRKVGETALKGETIVEYTFGRGDAVHSLKAPYDCRLDFQYVEYWDTVQTGDTLALITPVVIPGSANVPPVLPAMAPRRR